MNYYTAFIFGCFLVSVVSSEPDFTLSTEDLTVIVGESELMKVYLVDLEVEGYSLKLEADHSDLICPSGQNIDLNKTQNEAVIRVYGIAAGHAELTISLTNKTSVISEKFVRVTVQHNSAIAYTSVIIGWIYFVAWSVSFYPQIYENWKRRSVVGLNFDFLALNIVGFFLYSLFNCGLYWIPEVEREYKARYPKGLNPVQINDIVFSLHAVIVTLVTITQCMLYERGNQRVSTIARAILGVFAAILVISVILAWTKVFPWLEFLYICSYIKLAITLIKYVPQAIMNYRRKSTEGWSIGNILLDFTGGTLSMLQMILNAYNYDDWVSIFGDPTKFGLGLFSVVFDIFFMLQHYVFYRNSHYQPIPGEDSEDPTTDVEQPINVHYNSEDT